MKRERSIECEGWVIHYEADDDVHLLEAEKQPTRQEGNEGQPHITLESPDGRREGPLYFQELLPDASKVRQRLVEQGLPEECADKVFELLGISGGLADS